jgi:hypothetical protein
MEDSFVCKQIEKVHPVLLSTSLPAHIRKNMLFRIASEGADRP